MRECERALAMEDPIDPAYDTTVEERIESVRVKLRSHMQKSSSIVPKEKQTNVTRKSIKEMIKDLAAQFANLKNIASSEIKINQSRAYWESMSEEERRGACPWNMEAGGYPRAVEIIRKQSKPELAIEDKDQLSCELPKKEYEVDDISEFKKISLPKACSDNQNWLLSDDIERAKILESIHAEFQLLVKREYVTRENLSKLIGFSIKELQNSIPASELHIHGLDQTPLCICFLGLSKLKSIHKFLKVLSGLTDGNKVPDTGSSSIDTLSFLEFIPHGYHDDASTCKIRDDEVDVLPDGDDLLRGVFDPSALIGELLALWRFGQENIKHQGSQYFLAFEIEIRLFHLVSHKKELRNIETICNAELTKRVQDTNHVPKAENDDIGLERYHLNAILIVIIGATIDEAVDINQFKTEGASDQVDEEYACIRTAIMRQNERTT
ncbi:hypothetical protein Acr_00g0093640 [Actinidia rufa]|uniref:DUF629 domain-containing protein n=1 Tax=Actinidia rufa TaxID=165716 RepID=A0A7J0DZL1_9ERIC|nr:hypothetical protein Acr_00g0093640 [Actinidia rufa]